MQAVCVVRIAEHSVRLITSAGWVECWVCEHFQLLDTSQVPDLVVHIEEGYGHAFESYNVWSERTDANIQYERADYKLRIDRSYCEANLQVHDALALKHALVNLYSAFIVHFEWGLIIHSSCAIDNSKAYLFAGHSGAGKSTVASLSLPRLLLSDEASLVRIPVHGDLCVYDSPFRSELVSRGGFVKYPLAGIHLLKQSDCVDRTALTSADAFMQLMGKVFYWAHDPQETVKVIRLIEKLARYVATYDLQFQKNDSFWELIS